MTIYIAKRVYRIKSQMNAHFFDSCGFMLYANLFVTFKLVFDTRRVADRAATRVLHFFVRTALTSTLDSYMSTTINISPTISPAHLTEPCG